MNYHRTIYDSAGNQRIGSVDQPGCVIDSTSRVEFNSWADIESKLQNTYCLDYSLIKNSMVTNTHVTKSEITGMYLYDMKIHDMRINEPDDLFTWIDINHIVFKYERHQLFLKRDDVYIRNFQRMIRGVEHISHFINQIIFFNLSGM